MTPPTFLIIRTIVGALLILGATAYADPLLSSWYTANSTKYASIYESTSAEASKTVNTAWSGQTYPTYAGVHEIDYSSGPLRPTIFALSWDFAWHQNRTVEQNIGG